MDPKPELQPEMSIHRTDAGHAVIDARLKKLRRERRLIEHAIRSLSELAIARESRARRAARH